MKKSMILMMVVGFSITSNAAAMLIQFAKRPALKYSQAGMHNKLNRAEEGTLYVEHQRQKYLSAAIDEQDLELVDFLLRNCKENVCVDDFMMCRVESCEMLQCLVEYGLDLKGIKVNSKNYLSWLITRPGINDEFIQYVLDKGVNPHALDEGGNNLWHELARYPYSPKLVTHPSHSGRPAELHHFQMDKIQNRAELLRRLGVDVCVKNKGGKYPLDLVNESILDATEGRFLDKHNYLSARRGLRELRCIIEDLQEKVNRE